MANLEIKRNEQCGQHSSETLLKFERSEKSAQKLCEEFLKKRKTESGNVIHGANLKVGDLPDAMNEVKGEVVAIYDNAGIPSFMYRFTKKKNSELFKGGTQKTHPAFIIGGVEQDEIFISVYENCEINGKPYSLPYMEPWTNITNDEAAEACFSKDEGWHLMTRAEWGLIANECSMNDTLPHGNTNCGKYHGDECEHGDDTGKYGITKTGSGPATWTHNHKQGGIHDLCGNINEMVRGFRIKNGFLQIAKNNDAAMDIDLTAEGDGWENILDDNGKPIRVSFEERKIIFTTKDDAKHGCGGEQWENVVIDCKSEQLMELGLYHGELLAYCYIDATEGEYLPVCGGGWYNGSRAGVFNVRLSGPRSNSFGNIGFRSAYYRKLSTD